MGWCGRIWTAEPLLSEPDARLTTIARLFDRKTRRASANCSTHANVSGVGHFLYGPAISQRQSMVNKFIALSKRWAVAITRRPNQRQPEAQATVNKHKTCLCAGTSLFPCKHALDHAPIWAFGDFKDQISRFKLLPAVPKQALAVKPPHQKRTESFSHTQTNGHTVSHTHYHGPTISGRRNGPSSTPSAQRHSFKEAGHFRTADMA